MKFASYRRTTRADNADQTHNYSVELSSGDLIGAVYMSFSTVFDEVDVGDQSEFRAAWSIGQIFDASSSKAATLGLFRNTGTLRQSEININSEDNVGYVTTQRNNTTTQNRINISSIDHTNVAITVNQGAFSRSVSYHHTFWTGNSLDVEVNRSAIINVASIGNSYTQSTNISPDLAFVFINDSETDNTHSGIVHGGWGVIDMKNISDRFFFNTGYDATAPGYATILPTVQYMESLGRANTKFRIEPSSSANGLTWTVRSAGGISTRVADTTAIAAAFVKVDSGYAAKVKRFQAPGTYDATGTVRSVQTNSISLEFVQIMGTDQASIGAFAPGDNSWEKGAYGQGVWTKSHGNAPIALGMSMDETDEAQHTHDASSFALRVRYGNGNATGFRYYAHSLVCGSGAFSFTEFTGSYGLNAYQFWVGVGKSIRAPIHLMDANSKSIFLADDSDYNDNLLTLTPQSIDESAAIFFTSSLAAYLFVSSISGGAFFRSYPTTDNRDFPTPLSNVRAFPSD
jgi:hypothetical protein